MQVFKPTYYDDFRCLASACPDSCCHEWTVQVDEKAAAYYRGLPGELGRRLREVLKDEDGETVMAIENGRCPVWRDDGLCRIQAELGEQALCDVCRDFPRLRHDYGDFAELGLEMSCPEAARLIFTSAWVPMEEDCQPGGGETQYDALDMAVLKATRAQMLDILADREYDMGSALAIGLLYGYEAQAQLDGEEAMPFDKALALASAAQFAEESNAEEFLAFFRELEILTPRWRQMLARPAYPLQWPEELRAMAKYLVERYWLQAVSDFDLVGRVKLIVVSCLAVKLLGGNVLETAQLYSKEIENDADNVDAILEGVYTSPALTDARLLGLLLQK